MASSIESRDCSNVIDPPSNDEAPTIAVAIPCFNEAAAIRTVIAQFRAALPGAEIVVFDNNSTDGTAEAARDEGVRVEPVPEQGKGHVVRAAFALLRDRDVGRPRGRRRNLSGRGGPACWWLRSWREQPTWS